MTAHTPESQRAQILKPGPCGKQQSPASFQKTLGFHPKSCVGSKESLLLFVRYDEVKVKVHLSENAHSHLLFRQTKQQASQITATTYRWQVNKVNHARPSLEGKTQKTIGYFIFCYFYLNCLFLSRTVPQRNSLFITKLVSDAREKAMVLLSLSLLFLVRSSHMLCLREINRFLNRLLCILPLLVFAPSHHLWSLDRLSFLETPTAERRRVQPLRAPSTPRRRGFKPGLNQACHYSLSKLQGPHLQEKNKS